MIYLSLCRWDIVIKWLRVEAASVPKVEANGKNETSSSSEALEETDDGSEDDDKDKKGKKKRVGFRDRKVSCEMYINFYIL